jgi:hypothetical protein
MSAGNIFLSATLYLFGQSEFLFGSQICPFYGFCLLLGSLLLLQNWVQLAERVANVMKGYPTLSLTHGRKVLESCTSQCCWVQLQCLQVLIWSAVGFKYMTWSLLRFFLFIIISIVNACVNDFRTDTVTSCDLQVLEIRPGIAWDKGQAVNFLLESLGN